MTWKNLNSIYTIDLKNLKPKPKCKLCPKQLSWKIRKQWDGYTTSQYSSWENHEITLDFHVNRTYYSMHVRLLHYVYTYMCVCLTNNKFYSLTNGVYSIYKESKRNKPTNLREVYSDTTRCRNHIRNRAFNSPSQFIPSSLLNSTPTFLSSHELSLS